MLITSKFHDYYDSITAFGIDKTVVYRRESHGHPLLQDDADRLPQGRFIDSADQIGVRFRVIGFCGKVYPMVEVTKRALGHSKLTEDYTGFAYSPEGAIELMRKVGLTVTKERPFRWGRYHYLDSEALVKEAFQVGMYDAYLRFFREENTPVFLVGRGLKFPESSPSKVTRPCIWVNPCLKDWGFASVIDPVTAFQSIYMYISGVLGTPSAPTVDIDDKHKAIVHGHDGKFSFRKPPGGGRWR